MKKAFNVKSVTLLEKQKEDSKRTKQKHTSNNALQAPCAPKVKLDLESAASDFIFYNNLKNWINIEQRIGPP